MIDVWLPNMKTLKNPLGKNRERTLCRRPERTTPADGANHYTSLIQNMDVIVCPLTTVHQKVVDRRDTVDKFMNSNCTAVQRHQDYGTGNPTAGGAGKLLQNSSHVQTGKNNKQKIAKEGKGTVNELLTYWCWMR